jgi:hypothetical protein
MTYRVYLSNRHANSCRYSGDGRTKVAAMRKALRNASRQFLSYRCGAGAPYSLRDPHITHAVLWELFVGCYQMMHRQRCTRCGNTSADGGFNVELVRMGR